MAARILARFFFCVFIDWYKGKVNKNTKNHKANVQLFWPNKLGQKRIHFMAKKGTYSLSVHFSHSNSFPLVSILPFMVTNLLHYKNGFLLTKCFQKQAKFCVVQTGPEAKRYLDSCIHMSSSSSWKSIVSDEDIISDTKGENAAQGSMHRCNNTEGTWQQYLVQFSFFWKFWTPSWTAILQALWSVAS